MVLLSGLSILIRMWNDKRKERRVQQTEDDLSEKESASTDSIVFLLILGITTGCICSLSGAGGPVLVMPLLVACGVSARIAVGVALFDSVFIAVPACAGYLSRVDWKGMLGFWIGSRFAGKVPVQGLKIFVAVFSVCIAIYMLI